MVGHSPGRQGDTIAAVATPAGPGGVGLVRISGPEAPGICAAIFRPANPSSWTDPPPHARALFGLALDPGGQPLDRGYLTFFRRPRSYTGEDTAEIAIHASPYLLGRLLDSALGAGARPAEPGEFTFRAFRSGRLDLAQAEAVADLVAARTAHQARVAFEHADGALSRRLAPTREALVDLMARLEASLEFPEEDGTLMPRDAIPARIDAIRDPLRALVGSYARGRLLHRGATAVIVGAPNVGKSSLFNRLLGESRAIVTEVPGTTRDLLAESVEVAGIPLRLVDTAGLGSPADPVEAEGIRRAEEARRGADLVLFVQERSREPTGEERRWLDASPPDTLVVFNKSDLPPVRSAAWVREHARGRTSVEVSALTGDGMHALLDQVGGLLSAEEDGGDVPLTRRRQRDELARCLEGLDRARRSAEAGRGEELILVDLHDARSALGRVTGGLDVEAIYDRIFASFCIGK